MFGLGFTKELKITIASRDNSIKIMREQKVELGNRLHESNLNITRLAAENATLKQRIIILEGLLEPAKTAEQKAIDNFKKTGNFIYSDNAPQVKPSVHPNLQAYYDRGKTKRDAR